MGESQKYHAEWKKPRTGENNFYWKTSEQRLPLGGSKDGEEAERTFRAAAVLCNLTDLHYTDVTPVSEQNKI